ncbi:GNAT family N-acetyltransferase [Devosia submarina]|uniref:GNAT family N-acetyltransferase n=1 Tax=Devosia submarina TaxID=1173082 RepID=UPI000D38045A|nr:GNAT family N-acetyltransferase [Devosia submarina]
MEIVFEPEPQAETRAAILEGLISFNSRQTASQFGPPRNIALALRDPDTRASIGGLTARIGYSRMFVELLFVPEHLRGTGIGRQLMERAEDVAREHGCTGIWLDTFTFQAPGFYQKLGYSVFGEIQDYPPGFSRFFLHKPLS